MAFRWSHKFKLLMPSVRKVHHSGTTLQNTAKRHFVTKTITFASAMSLGAGITYGIMSRQLPVSIDTSQTFSKPSSRPKDPVLGVLNLANIKIMDSLQTRVVDNVSQEEKEAIRKQALYQEEQKIHSPINETQERYDDLYGIQYWGIDAVNVAIDSSMNSFNPFRDYNSTWKENCKRSLIRGYCAQIYKAIREKQMKLSINDEECRRGQWICVNVMDQDIELKNNEYGEETIIIKGYQVMYYPSRKSIEKNGWVFDNFDNCYFACLGFETVFVTRLH